jgi:hypothetical protein
MEKLENIPWIQEIIKTRPVLIDELHADKRELLGREPLKNELNIILNKPEILTSLLKGTGHEKHLQIRVTTKKPQGDNLRPHSSLSRVTGINQ